MMRKFVIGLICGAVLMFSGQALAGTISNIGKKIQGEYAIVVDGKKLETKAIAVNGTTYTPNRSLADAVGYDVAFTDQTVVYTSEEVAPTPITPIETPESTESPAPIESPAASQETGGVNMEMDILISKLNGVNGDIEGIKKHIYSLENSDPETEEGKAATKARIAELKAKLADWETLKVELEAKKAELAAKP